MQVALLVILFVVALHSFRIPLLAGLITEVAQLLDREALRETDPGLLVDELALLAQLIAQMADNGRRLITDLAGGEPGGDSRQGLQLLADAKTIRGRCARHLAGGGDEGAWALSGEQVIASLLSAMDDPTELALETIDGGGEPPGVYEIVVGMKVEVSNRSLEPLHIQHDNILQTNF